MYTSYFAKSPRCVILWIIAASVNCGSAIANDDLSDFVGMPSSKLVESLGEPLLQKPDELWYSRKPRISNPWRNAPSVNISRGSSGVNVGNEFQTIQFAKLPCEIVAKVDTADLIESVEQIGPGCFEYIYYLRLQNAAKTTP